MKGGGDDETQNLSGQTFTSGTPLTWKMKVIKGGANSSTFGYYTNSNLQINTDGYGLAHHLQSVPPYKIVLGIY